jgi:hypothetical protein
VVRARTAVVALVTDIVNARWFLTRPRGG